MLSCAHLSYAYGDGPYVLSDVSLGVGPGEVVGLAGRSGSGKTTLLSCLGGGLAPREGGIEVDGCVPGAGDGSHGRLRALVGLVHQHPEEQLFGRTVAEDVGFGPRNQGLPATEVEGRVAEALQAVGLGWLDAEARSPFSLSGGERRRTAIAGVLAMRPRYLLLDEPTAGLDPHGRDELLALVTKVAEGGRGVLMVSHDLDVLARVCSRVVLLRDGRVAASGPLRTVLGDAGGVRAAGLVPPVGVELAEALRARGVEVPPGSLTASQIAAAVRRWRAQGGGEA